MRATAINFAWLTWDLRHPSIPCVDNTEAERLATWYDETCNELAQVAGGDLVDAKLIFAHNPQVGACRSGRRSNRLASAVSDGSSQSKQKKVLPRRREGNAYQFADAKLALG